MIRQRYSIAQAFVKHKKIIRLQVKQNEKQF